MNKEIVNKITIRREEQPDQRAVEELTREAFWNVHEPGCTEHFILHNMRRHRDFVPELSLIAVYEGRPAGHIAYTRGMIAGNDGSSREVLCFGPISVHPDFQRAGIGGMLIEESAKRAAGLGYEAICIYGDPRYYRKHGFECSEIYDIRTEDGMYAVALLVRELKKGALKTLSGRFCESKAFEVDMQEFETYETQFPPKIKGEQESQKDFQVLVSLRFSS